MCVYIYVCIYIYIYRWGEPAVSRPLLLHCALGPPLGSRQRLGPSSGAASARGWAWSKYRRGVSKGVIPEGVRRERVCPPLPWHAPHLCITAWPLQDICLRRGCCARINHPFIPPRSPALPTLVQYYSTTIGQYTTPLPTIDLFIDITMHCLSSSDGSSRL